MMRGSIHDQPIQWEIVNPLGAGDWDQRVRNHPDHSVFHLSAWARVLAEIYGHRPVYLRFHRGTGEIALLPLMEVASWCTGKRAVSLPFSDFAGPLWFRPDAADEVRELLAELSVARNWTHLEIRDFAGPTTGLPVFCSYVAHQLDLRPGLEFIEKNLNPATRRALRKSERSKLELDVASDQKSVSVFYHLHCRTRRRHGLPPQPFRFFEAIGRHLIGTGLGEVVIARDRGIAVAAAVFLRSGERAIYKFGASEPAAWDLRPNQAVMWAAIRHLFESGCETLHFGRTSNDDEGLCRFKSSWGTIASPLDYFRYVASQAVWHAPRRSRSESHAWLFGHLPLGLNRLAGKLIYPHLD